LYGSGFLWSMAFFFPSLFLEKNLLVGVVLDYYR